MLMPQEIETERLILRHNMPLTLEFCKKVYAGIDKSRKTLEVWLSWVSKVHSAEDEFYALTSDQKSWEEGTSFGYFIYQKNTDHILGALGLCPVDHVNKNAELGYWLFANAVGNGYMAEAICSLENTAFTILNLNRIVIKTDPKNLRSEHVAKKSGYHLDGIMRQDVWDNYHQCFRDTNVWSKLKSDWEKTHI